MSSERRTVGIIGGAGKMGSHFAELFAKDDYRVLISDIRTEEAKKLAADKKYEFVETNEELVRRSDITVYSVLPMSTAIKVMSETARYARAGSLLTHVTSVQSKPEAVLLKYSNSTVAVIGIHPMYDPMQSMRGQVVSLTPARPYNWLNIMENFLSKNGARIEKTTAEEHDKLMAIVQGVTHFLNIILPLVPNEMRTTMHDVLKFSSPIYKIKFSIAARILNQDPMLYAEIFTLNPYTKPALEAMTSIIGNLKKLVDMDDTKRLVREFRKSSEICGELKGPSTYLTNILIEETIKEMNDIVIL